MQLDPCKTPLNEQDTLKKYKLFLSTITAECGENTEIKKSQNLQFTSKQLFT